LDQRHDVSFAVLEPGGLGVAGAGDASSRLDLGRVVLLELHAAALELRNLVFDIVHLPERLARSGTAGVGCRVHEAQRVVGELVDYTTDPFLLGLETDLLLVNCLARARSFTGM